jgi:hypothetical protein
VEEDFPVTAGHNDILTEMLRRANFYSLPRFGWNDLSRNSHPSPNRGVAVGSFGTLGSAADRPTPNTTWPPSQKSLWPG